LKGRYVAAKNNFGSALQAGSAEVLQDAGLGAFCFWRKLGRAVALTAAQQVIARDADVDDARRANAPVRNSVGIVEISADRLKRSTYAARIFRIVNPIVISEAFERPKDSRLVRHPRIPSQE
jgi:hypothetical protein